MPHWPAQCQHAKLGKLRSKIGSWNSHPIFKFLKPICEFVQLAAWQLAAVARPLQGPVASARSCICPFLCDRSPSEQAITGADPSSGHQAPMLLRDASGCDDRSVTSCSCSRALSSLADSDPKAKSALRIRKGGKSIPSQPKVSRTQRWRTQGRILPATMAPLRPRPSGGIFDQNSAALPKAW